MCIVLPTNALVLQATWRGGALGDVFLCSFIFVEFEMYCFCIQPQSHVIKKIVFPLKIVPSFEWLQRFEENWSTEVTLMA